MRLLSNEFIFPENENSTFKHENKYVCASTIRANLPLEAHEIARAVLVFVAISLAALKLIIIVVIVIVVVIVVFLDAVVYIFFSTSIATGDTLVPITVKVEGHTRKTDEYHVGMDARAINLQIRSAGRNGYKPTVGSI